MRNFQLIHEDGKTKSYDSSRKMLIDLFHQTRKPGIPDIEIELLANTMEKIFLFSEWDDGHYPLFASFHLKISTHARQKTTHL